MFMNLLRVYQNIWLRNIILGIVYFIIVYMGVRTEEHYTDSNPEILNDKGHFIMQVNDSSKDNCENLRKISLLLFMKHVTNAFFHFLQHL